MKTLTTSEYQNLLKQLATAFSSKILHYHWSFHFLFFGEEVNIPRNFSRNVTNGFSAIKTLMLCFIIPITENLKMITDEIENPTVWKNNYNSILNQIQIEFGRYASDHSTKDTLEKSQTSIKVYLQTLIYKPVENIVKEKWR